MDKNQLFWRRCVDGLDRSRSLGRNSWLERDIVLLHRLELQKQHWRQQTLGEGSSDRFAAAAADVERW